MPSMNIRSDDYVRHSLKWKNRGGTGLQITLQREEEEEAD